MPTTMGHLGAMICELREWPPIPIPDDLDVIQWGVLEYQNGAVARLLVSQASPTLFFIDYGDGTIHYVNVQPGMEAFAKWCPHEWVPQSKE